jgi:hypothetical protein
MPNRWSKKRDPAFHAQRSAPELGVRRLGSLKIDGLLVEGGPGVQASHLKGGALWLADDDDFGPIVLTLLHRLRQGAS